MPNRCRPTAWFASLLVLLAAGVCPPLRAAEELVVQFDGLALPIDLRDLETWTRNPGQPLSHQAVWLNLLDAESRQGLIRLLQAPLLRDRSFGMALLNSWTGEQLLREVGGLLQGPAGQNTAPLLLDTLRQLVERQGAVTSLELLRAVPLDRLTLQVDRLLALAEFWRDQLHHQAEALALLRRQPLPHHHSRVRIPSRTDRHRSAAPLQLQLPVAHRPAPLPLEIWPALAPAPQPRPWLVLMSGLGGSSSQLSWLAQALAEAGWSVLVVEHPGSDAAAVQASLRGQDPPPGAESVPERLADLQAVLAARLADQLPGLPAASLRRDGVVLVGHSLGGLAALMAAGLVPEAGLGRRCDEALRALPLLNLSRLLQCQLPAVTGDGGPPLSAATPTSARIAGVPLRGVITYNGFGSLLWPQAGLAPLPLPVLMVGGSLDLVTPPVPEQLALLASSHHPHSRLVLVDGASHFSPVRLQQQEQALFQLGDDLVGKDPRQVQALLLQLTLDFLALEHHPTLLPSQRREHGGVVATVLDPAAARRWRDALPPAPRFRSAPVGRAGPPADPP